jgi:flavin-dependent dehydrogenase
MSIPPTLALADATGRRWDAVVVGAGPAGAMAARELARNGLRVLLVERAAFPRSKVCGCCLNARSLATLKAVGLGTLTARCGARPLHTLQLGGQGTEARVALPQGVALSREIFDAALVSEAMRSGADFLPRTRAILEGVERDRRRVRLEQAYPSLSPGARVGNDVVSASVVLAADGLGGNLLARAGVTSAPPEPGARIGAGVVLEEAPAFYRPGVVFMACAAHGYVGLVRLEDGRLDLGAALDTAWVRRRGGPGEAAGDVLSSVGWPLPDRLAQRGWKGTAPLTRHAGRLAAERVFVLGDAAGYVEPFTGEGIGWALAAGVAVAPLAVSAAVDWQPELARQWAIVHRRIVGHRLVCRTTAAVLRWPRLVEWAIRLLAIAPALAAPVVGLLNRKERV